ncbi:MAG: ATP-binding protein [Bacteroidota bacterium]|nr:ATP-binding protein [Bacteroidota bacterium]
MQYSNLTGGLSEADTELLENDIESSIILNLIINSFPSNLFIFNRDGLILDYKSKDTDLLQISPSKFLNKNICNFLTPEVNKKFINGFIKINAGSPVVRFESKICIGGNNKIFEVKLLPHANQKIVGIFKDITEKRELENNFNTLWDSSVDGLVLIENGRIIKANPAFSYISGIPIQDLSNKSINDLLLTSNDEIINSQAISIIPDYDSKIVNKSMTFVSNKTVEVEVSYSLVNQDSASTVLGIFREAGAKKNFEEKYLLLEKLAILGKYSTYIAHEIKTSLASIKMCLDIFRDDFTSTKRLHKIYELFQSETNRLNKLSKTILQFARPTEPIIVSINLKAFFDKLAEFNSVKFFKKHIEFVNNCPSIYSKGDYSKLQSAFLNMIDNSVESINENGKIQVNTKINKEKNRVSIFLEDNGQGCKEPEKLFEPYYTSKVTGTGLGLAISKKNIEEQNGTVKLVSSRQGSTIFEVQLPYEEHNG